MNKEPNILAAVSFMIIQEWNKLLTSQLIETNANAIIKTNITRNHHNTKANLERIFKKKMTYIHNQKVNRKTHTKTQSWTHSSSQKPHDTWQKLMALGRVNRSGKKVIRRVEKEQMLVLSRAAHATPPTVCHERRVQLIASPSA